LIAFMGMMFASGCAEPTYDIRFDREELDFGEIQQGSNIELVFEFENTGTGTLVIRDVLPQCGCTIPRAWDVAVPSGHRGRIPVTFESGRESGDLTRVIDLMTNVPDKSKLTLMLKGRVVKPALVVAPSNLFLAEVTSRTRKLNGTFRIVNNTAKPLVVTNVETPNDIATTHTLSETKKGKEFLLDFTVRAPFSGPERVQRQFTLTTNDPVEPVLRLFFSYRVLPVIEVYPNVLRIEPDDIKRTETTLNIYIRNNEGNPVSVYDLSVRNDRGISCTVDDNNARPSTRIEVRIPKGFRIDAKPESVISFRVEGDPERKLYSAIVGPKDPTKPLD
jgi:hypothetical protein